MATLRILVVMHQLDVLVLAARGVRSRRISVSRSK
jgi:hypothetical protein